MAKKKPYTKEFADFRPNKSNFKYHDEEEHIKISDIGDMFSVRLNKRTTNLGYFLTLATKDKYHGFLESVSKILLCIFSIAWDKEFLEDIMKAYIACLERNKKQYGLKEDISEEEDKKIVDEQRKLHEAEEKLREAGKDEN